MSHNYVRGASLSSSVFQEEIRQMLAESGASRFRIASEYRRAAVVFSLGDRTFRMLVSPPGPADSQSERTHDWIQPSSRPHESKSAQEAARQAWRQLSLLIRAKLDAVASGIVTFDEEFLAYMVLPGGGTVFQATAPAIAAAYGDAEDSGAQG
ncbi:hypothetical protein [Sinomonas sp. G460-2]|uniref:hypothetical protein n=1 Tax=Sinomonas sp. G460-2 TaxID=3393464 RepID=UPI0039F07A5C